MNRKKPSLQPFVLAFHFALLYLLGLSLAAHAGTGPSKAMGIKIHVEGDGWGDADPDELEALLYAVADELVAAPSRQLTYPIIVTHAEGSPVTLYERGPRGEFLVRLTAQDRRWSQFAYQFGHELCHIMSNFDAPQAGPQGKRNQWFEETLCETAALYTLRSMARTWETGAPYPSWEDYAPALRSYADRLIGEDHRRLPAGATLASWLGNNLEQLGRNPYMRNRNEVVANVLLPMFEKSPANWGALAYLNLDPNDASCDLGTYLQHWYANAPSEHKDFVRTVISRLGLAPSYAAATRDGGRDTDIPAEAQAGPAGPLSH